MRPLLPLLRVLALLFAACSYSISPGEGPPLAAPPDLAEPTSGLPDLARPPPPPPPADGGEPPPRCMGLVMPPFDEELRMRTPDGRTRVASVHVPRTYDPRIPVPLLLNFHGFLSNPWQQEMLSEMKRRSEARNFIVVYPQGSGDGLDPLSWNAGACCPPALDKKVDDVAYVRQLLDRLQQTHCIDRRRIFATGLSNGGFFAYRLACELSDRIAAVAPVAGQSGLMDCQPVRPVPVLHFHGTQDSLVPYHGGSPPFLNTLKFPSVKESVEGWAVRNACTKDKRTTLTLPDARCEAWEGCRADATVTLCTVERGGHSWPGGPALQGVVLGYTSPHLKASDLMLDFFQAHPLP